jgi:osmotically-inducible protein OsmY
MPTAKRAILAALLTGALATPALATQPDAWITTKAKLALLTTEGVSATAVSIDTINQQVTLHGKVGSAEEKAKVETVVKAIDGVQGVRNLLVVVAPKHEEAVQRADTEIEKQVGSALRAQPSMKDSAITVSRRPPRRCSSSAPCRGR